MEITVTVPTLLRDSTGGQTDLQLTATTLAEALDQLRAQYPLLRVHIWDETNRLRPHVLLFYNGENIQRLDPATIVLQPRDQLQVLQAVSGG
jgi:molybdopterin converting factor small subunit